MININSKSIVHMHRFNRRDSVLKCLSNEIIDKNLFLPDERDFGSGNSGNYYGFIPVETSWI
jgi:hypothetical protein